MTIERRLAHAGFTLTRDYPVPSRRSGKRSPTRSRSAAGSATVTTFESREWAFDFRVGGRDVDEAKFHDGPLSRYEAVYTDIVEHVRIVTTYDMWLDGIHMSTSVASFEFEQIPEGTRLTHAEHGVFFDKFWTTAPTAKKAREASSKPSADTSDKQHCTPRYVNSSSLARARRRGPGGSSPSRHRGRTGLLSPSAHGRTRMIVFPVRRSVVLKAATATSRVATVPMFVRSRRPAPAGTTSLNGARSDTCDNEFDR